MEAYFNNHNAWLSTPDALRSAHDQQQTSTSTPTQNGNDEWGKAASAIDMPDFGLGDLQAASSASPTNTVPMQHLYQFPTNGYFPTMAPFNMVSYGQAAAASAWPQQNLPLSSYSTLNGATSSIGSTQHQQQQQQASSQSSAAVQQSMIDPALTASNNTPSYSPPPSSSSQGARHSPPMQFSNPFPQQQQHQNPHSPPALSMSPLYLLHQQQQQQQQQQQRTLNPQQLSMAYPFMYPMQQHVQSPMQTNLTASSSHTSTPPPASSSISSNSVVPPASTSGPAPEPSDPATFKQTLNRLLTPSALSDAGTVRRLMDAIAEHGSTRVSPEMRMELASRIRDGAGNAFFAAWARDSEAMVLLVNWLKAGVTGKDDGHWESTIMPLLHVLDRLPLTISLLKEHRLGKLTTALLKSDTVSPAIKDMASNISNKWRTLIEPGSGGGTKDKDTSSSAAMLKKVEIEDKTRKRKLADGASKPPSKVSVVSVGAGTAGSARAVKVKKEKVVVTAVKDAKADASFFSAPKPKPRLPSFKKAPAPPSMSNAASGGSGGGVDVAQPSHENAFQQALKEMKGRTPSVAANAASSASAANKSDSASANANAIAKAPTPDLVKNIKKRKSVSWAPEGHLEKVKLIETAVYDDDPADGAHGAHSIRDLERAEGAAMHIHLFEESIDWYEPQALEFPEDIDAAERGGQSQEKLVQEEREKNTLGALYFAGSQIPDTPGEPATQIAPDQVDSEARTMVVGADIQPFFQQAMSVSDLVGQLAANTGGAAANAFGTVENGTVAQGSGIGDVAMSDVSNAIGVSGGFDLSKLDPNALSSLAASLGLAGFNFGAAPVPDGSNGYTSQGASSWGAYAQQHQMPQQQGYTDSGYAPDERERDERGGRGGMRGRGRGARGRGGGGGDSKSRRRQCNFYAQGSCRYGDACHFSHEGPSGQQGYYD